MAETLIAWNDLLKQFPPAIQDDSIEKDWLDAVRALPHKLVVLDDDPTGVQTVHSIPVYTTWNKDSLRHVLTDESKVVYILTNSRSLSPIETARLHRRLGEDLARLATQRNIPYLLISRSDSTLRGHYPLETDVLAKTIQPEGLPDAEIIIPFFEEGGRITLEDTHYVLEGKFLVPAGQSEFARDAVFGYESSNLKEWIEEKTKGRVQRDTVKSISIDMIRSARAIARIEEVLKSAVNGQKIIINAVDYNDCKTFVVALCRAITSGKRFIFRSAASFVRIIGGILPRPYLRASDLFHHLEKRNRGLIIAGSHVGKTTKQLVQLMELEDMECIEWDVSRSLDKALWQRDIDALSKRIAAALADGRDVCLYTSRTYWEDPSATAAESRLLTGARISGGLVDVVRKLHRRPGFIVAKGGVTSSDIGVKALDVKRALVLGQILPGVPLWKLGDESRFPGIPYIVFPGNVGDDCALKQTVKILRGDSYSCRCLRFS
ncbi:MAG: hydroxyacid dehydrogenase [Deltaproteobacteria bacterium]|nr:hydroxyacid dehydrogenase [Deltaproteobacteria bacterium]